MLDRRRFLSMTGVVAGTILTPVRWLAKGTSLEAAQRESASGELFAGFLLLPEGAPVPPIVEQPAQGPPTLCGAGPRSKREAQADFQPAAVHHSFGNEVDLVNDLSFPMYTIRDLPKGLRRASAQVLRQATGEIYEASIGFESFDARRGAWDSNVSVTAVASFPQPFPVWYGPELVVERVDFLPTPGLQVKTAAGYVFHWIEHGALYTLSVENQPDLKTVRKLVDSLGFVQ